MPTKTIDPFNCKHDFALHDFKKDADGVNITVYHCIKCRTQKHFYTKDIEALSDKQFKEFQKQMRQNKI